MPNLSYTPVSQRSMKNHKIISVPLSHPHTLENPSKFLALWKLWWRDQFIAGFRAQPNAITDFKNVCERRIKGKHMENVQYAWFQLQQKPREPGQLFVMFFVFPETQIRQEAFSFEEVHGYGYKQAAFQKVTFETLPSSWKFETREVSELIRGSLLPLKISSFMSPQMFLAPPCWTLYLLCLRSLLPAERTTFIFSIFFPDNSFFFPLCVTQEDGISLIKQLLPPAISTTIHCGWTHSLGRSNLQ